MNAVIKKNILALAVALTLFFIKGAAQGDKPLSLTYEWGQGNAHNLPTHTQIQVKVPIQVTLNPATLKPDSIKMFIEKTTVEWGPPGKTSTKKLSEILPDTIVKKSKLNLLDIAPFLKLNAGDVVHIAPYLGKAPTGKNNVDTIEVIAAQPGPGGNTAGTSLGGCPCDDKSLETALKNLVDKLPPYPLAKDTTIGSKNKTTADAPEICSACNSDTEAATARQKKFDDSVRAVCQTCSIDENMIYYDFSCKRFYKLRKNSSAVYDTVSFELGQQVLTPGQRVQVTVVNVNRYVYNVSIKGTNIKYESTMPALLSELFFASDTSKTVGSLIKAKLQSVAGTSNTNTTLSGGSVGNATGTDQASTLCCRYSIYMRSAAVFDSLYNNLLAKKISAYSLCSTFPCCTPADTIMKSYALMLDLLTFARQRLADLQAVLPDGTSPDVKTELQNALPSKADLEKLYLFIQNIRSRNSSFTSPPVWVTGNRFELVLKITPWKEIETNIPHPYEHDSMYLDFPVIHKWITSFSSGSFISIDKYLQNITYDWQPVVSNNGGVVDNSHYRLVPNGYSKQPVGLSAFANLEYKKSAGFGYGASAGLGITIESSPSLAYLGGLSLFFGDLNQLVVTAGLSGMQVNQLNASLQTFANNGTVFAAAARPQISYYPEFKTGVFFSISYTPFKYAKRPVKKAEEAAQAQKPADNKNNNTPQTTGNKQQTNTTAAATGNNKGANTAAAPANQSPNPPATNN